MIAYKTKKKNNNAFLCYFFYRLFQFFPFLIHAEEMPNYLGMPGASRMKALGEAWHALDDAARAPFLQKTEIDKQRVAVEKEGLLPPGSEWQNLSATERQELLDELRNKSDIVGLARGISRKAAFKTFKNFIC